MNLATSSLPLARVSGIEVRAHWSLLLILIVDASLAIGGNRGLAVWGVMALCLFGSVLLHEFGHALAARAVGGDCRRIVLWMLGGLASCDTPMRPWPQFAVAAAGPLVTGVIGGAAWALRHVGDRVGWLQGQPMLEFAVDYTAFVNLRMLAFNLLPIIPLDGSQMLRSALWRWLGLRRASMIALYVSFPAVIGVLMWAGLNGNMLFLTLGVWMTFGVVQELTLMRLGHLDEESWMQAPRRPGWLARWRRERERRALARREREEAAEQETVDRLLAKVGEQGLASLTKHERATLEGYSRKQRERQEIGGRR